MSGWWRCPRCGFTIRLDTEPKLLSICCLQRYVFVQRAGDAE